ncbi:ADP-ribosylglycohydrolase family protein [Cellulosilyticum ruminicola]|uniref:ADP-ribosylglycohydrolase family protein n=1 Tax=Cellulosilyticum ruminicola TaxID=425254 RepID=UPI0006D1EE1F|nr:ADP-ribosylglycohydrolase family protein [Cellulosilyticum ruminicola]
MKNKPEYLEGCLLGGAIGDALGAPVEFKKYDEIITVYGENGIIELIPGLGRKEALITDGTQMTMFTVEGLLRSMTRAKRKGVQWDKNDIAHTVFRAYLRWLYTQGLNTPHWAEKDYDGFLVKIKKLHAYREAGITSITALGKGIKGSVAHPVNDSKGCGGLMRIAPIGLVDLEEDVFEIGCEVAAITHGGACAYLPAGTLAVIIKELVRGQEITYAIGRALQRLKLEPKNEQCVECIEKTLILIEEDGITREKIESLGEGIFAHEALAMALYIAGNTIRHTKGTREDIREALCKAVNHNGGSDIVGAITGQILGVYYGVEKIENLFKVPVELEKEIRDLAKDLYILYEDTPQWLEKYPAW